MKMNYRRLFCSIRTPEYACRMLKYNARNANHNALIMSRYAQLYTFTKVGLPL